MELVIVFMGMAMISMTLAIGAFAMKKDNLANDAAMTATGFIGAAIVGLFFV